MNRRMKKKAENIRRKKLHRILDQVLDINGLKARQKTRTGDKPTAFFWFNGNTGITDIMVHYTGWEHGSRADMSKMVGLYPRAWNDNADDVIKQLDDLKERLHV